MKIIYLIHQFYPEFYTGTEKFILNLASMMQKAGNKVKVVTYSFYEDSFYDQARGAILWKNFVYQGLPVLALKHKQIPLELNHTLGGTGLSEMARDLIRREKPDIVHVGHPMRVSALVYAMAALRKPYIITLTDFFLACPKVILVTSGKTLCNGPEEGKACRHLCPELKVDYVTKRLQDAKELLSHAKLVVAPSRFLAEVFRREFPGLEVKVINHGLNFSRLTKNEKSYTNHAPVIFCYAGSLNPHKGIHILIEAFRKISCSNALLKIYGSGPYAKELMAMARGDGRIEFCGVYSEQKTGEILSAVDVVVVPSLWYENYPLVLHEALACNVPVVATDVGGMAEKIQNGMNGFVFRLGDAQHLQAVLQKIVDDPTVLNPLKHNINRMMIPGIEEEAYTYGRAYELVVHATTPTRRKP